MRGWKFTLDGAFTIFHGNFPTCFSVTVTFSPSTEGNFAIFFPICFLCFVSESTMSSVLGIILRVVMREKDDDVMENFHSARMLDVSRSTSCMKREHANQMNFIEFDVF